MRGAWVGLILVVSCANGGELDEALTGRREVVGRLDAGEGEAGPRPDAAPDLGAGCAPEICNGRDDDCDGIADEGADEPCGPETPMGACSTGVRRCVDGLLGDCRGAQVPQMEICDTVDNDCDGAVDEGDCAPCAPGAFQPCYSGAPESFNVGPCTAGAQTCDPEGRFGRCEGEITPGIEACNGADDDCDGVADEDFADRLNSACTVGTGACVREGVLRCGPDGLACDAPEIAPGVERCSGTDEDCDGRIDEGFGVGEPCQSGLGACAREGATRCGDARDPLCDAEPGLPTDERCNGEDDDCDGEADEGQLSCYTGPEETRGVGACRAGRARCGAPCADEVLPQEEQCDGRDEDCDGEVDEGGCRCEPGDRVPCFEGEGEPGVGRCREGQRTCDQRATYGPCEGVVAAAPEACNGQDDDCDGRTDEGLVEACGAEEGRCQRGQRTCAAGDWGVCVGEVRPIAEQCNAVDDDCDGRADEEVVRPCGTGIGVCRPGQQICRGGEFDACVGEVGPTAETCDQRDEDCDGRVDEGVTNACGACGPVPAEACNGRDDDCDNRVDENVTNACGACGPVPAEACNGRDDDCDGRIDEDLPPGCEPCEVAADCDDGNMCTQEDCVANRCVGAAVAGPCDDGRFCNGRDSCVGGQCAEHVGDPCGGGFCDEVADRCNECLDGRHCPPDLAGVWGACMFDGPCSEQGTQVRTLIESACLGGACVAEMMEQTRGCARDTEGQPCEGGACLGGACAEAFDLTAVVAGPVGGHARLRVGCLLTGASCLASGSGDACVVPCPVGARVTVCCANGDECGGDPVAPNPRVEIDSVSALGLLESTCGAGAGGFEACGGRMDANDATVTCRFFRDGGIEP